MSDVSIHGSSTVYRSLSLKLVVLIRMAKGCIEDVSGTVRVP